MAISAAKIIVAYSAGPNWKAMEAMDGAARATINVPMVPATKEPTAAVASATPALPCLAIW